MKPKEILLLRAEKRTSAAIISAFSFAAFAANAATVISDEIQSTLIPIPGNEIINLSSISTPVSAPLSITLQEWGLVTPGPLAPGTTATWTSGAFGPVVLSVSSTDDSWLTTTSPADVAEMVLFGDFSTASLNITSGTLLGNLPTNYVFSGIPEPSTALLGMVGVSFLLRRRRTV